MVSSYGSTPFPLLKIPSNYSIPYRRIASTFIPGLNQSFIYHQLTDSTLAEESWDTSAKNWVTRNITVETPDSILSLS